MFKRNLRYTLQGHKKLITRLTWSPDGELLASGSDDQTIVLWDLDGNKIQTFASPYDTIKNLVWSPDGLSMLISSIYDDFYIMDVRSGILQGKVTRHAGWITSLAWSPDGEIIVSACADGIISIWYAKNYVLLKSFGADSNLIRCVAWSPDGRMLASSSFGQNIQLWDTKSWKQIRRLKGHNDSVDCLVWTSDTQRLASSSSDNTICIWNPENGKNIKTLESAKGNITSISFSLDGNLLASMDEVGNVSLWCCNTWKIIDTFDEQSAGKLRNGLAFNPRMPILASICQKKGAVNVYDIEDGTSRIADTLTDSESPKSSGEFAQSAQKVENATDTESLFNQKPDKEFKTLTTPSRVNQSFTTWAGSSKCTLAFVFTDMLGSTMLCNRLGNETFNKLRHAHFTQAHYLINKHNGYEIKTIGDSVMAAFRAASEAFDFALEFYTNMGDDRIEIRAGIHVGPVSIEHNDAFGITVNYTSRIEKMAKESEIWVSNEAKIHIEQEGSERHSEIEWLEHPDCKLKGFEGKHLLWSVSNPKI